MHPTVSILVPVFNVQNYIEQCARSLFEQSYKEVEFVFVDDCSPDNSISVLKSVLEEYPIIKKRVKIVSHSRNKGLAASRLTGIEKASGDYLMFVDSDDFIESNAVELLIKTALNDNSDIVTAGIKHIFIGKTTISLPPKNLNKYKYLKLILEGKVSHNSVSRLFKKCLFDNNENLFIEGINSGEDYLMITRIFYYAKKISFVYQPLYNYIHTNPHSFTYSFKRNNFEQCSKAEAIVRKFYEDKDESVYLESQKIGCLKAKAQNIILLLLKEYDIADYQDVLNIYNNDERQLLSKVPFQYRVILRFSKILDVKKMTNLVRIGYRVKDFLKKL